MKKKMKKAKAKSASKKPAVNKTPLQPLQDRVVVKPLTAEEMGTTTQFGIIIPDSAKDKPEQGTVIAVGPGKIDSGQRIPVGVSVGDRVMFSKYGYDEIKMNGVTYYVIAEANILAVIN